MFRCRILVVGIGAFLSCHIASEARVAFVDGRRPDCGDGLSWSTAYAHLQDALTAARDSAYGITEIWVAAGTYCPDRDCVHPAGSGDREARFQLVDGVAVYGGFAGDEEPGGFNIADRDLSLNVTRLSGDLAKNDGAQWTNRQENSYRVVEARGVASATILDGFVISGAEDICGEVERVSGGLYVVNGSPTVTRCVFTGNRACRGGGLNNDSGAPTLSWCVFEGNTAAAGGGMRSMNGNARVVSCVFRGNEAASGGGGALLNDATALVNCAFVGNQAGSLSSGHGGGGVYCWQGSPSLVNCTLIENTASSGFAVYCYSGNPSLANCVVWGNAAPPNSSSAGASAVTGTVTVTYSCVQGGWPGIGNIGTDPRLVLVNGEVVGLRHGSPCIDAGDSTALPAGVAVDVAGSPRFVDDPAAPNTGPQGIPPSTAIDMGAYEYQLCPTGPLYVKAGGGVGGDGRSWSTPFAHLQDALAAAAVDSGVSEIWVASGIYLPDRDASHSAGTGDRTSPFRLLSGVALYGGFPGEPGQEGDLSVRAPAAYETILSGDLAGDDGAAWSNRGDNSYHVVTAGGAGSVYVLDGFTVSGGNASGNSPDNSGGGMLVSLGCSLQLNSCRFRENMAGNSGGGLYDDGANSVLIDCVFDGNRAAVDGAGMAAIKSSPALTRCTFSGNTGSGLTVSQGAPIVTACTFSGNSGAGVSLTALTGSSVTCCEFRGNKGAGAICSGSGLIDHCTFTGNSGAGLSLSALTGSSVTYCEFRGNKSAGAICSGAGLIDHCTFSENSSVSGGGMCISSGNPTLTNCLFDGNSASSGGGLYVGACRPALTRCTFKGNAGDYGGGLYLNDGGSSLVNCVFVSNTANYGGALFGKRVTGTQGSVSATNSTFVDNRSNGSQTAGGVHSVGGPIYLTNCILWSNSPEQVYPIGNVNARYSCIQGGLLGEGNIDTNPGPVFTSRGNLRLQRGSACIDAGDGTRVPTEVTTDAGGNPRFVDDPLVSNSDRSGVPPRAAVDMGAFEYQPSPIGRLYVKAGAAPGGDGRSWSTAYAFLQDALALAALDPVGAEIWVAAGVYQPDRDAGHPNGTGDRVVTFQVWGHTPLYGGFPGLPGQEDDFSVRRPARYASILSGDLCSNDNPDPASREENSSHVLMVEGVGSVDVLDGFTISGGNAAKWSDGFLSLCGGGLLIRGGGPTVTHCVFGGNSAQDGGGVYSRLSSPSFRGCVFYGNSASDMGGGMRLSDGKPKIVNCTFSNNSASSGGGIGRDEAASEPAMIVTNCVLWGNQIPQIYGPAKVSYSCIEKGRTGVGNIKVDPLFVGNGDYRLRPGSPCIDAGSDAATPSEILVDLDGHARWMDDPASVDCLTAPGTCGQRPIVDMGAYEFIAGDFDRDSDIDGEDLVVFLACVTGAAIPSMDGCEKADLDHDGDVDQSDFGILQRCHSGSGADVDPDCTSG